MTHIKIVNKDAKPNLITMECNDGAENNILRWYGAFYAGDDYTVHINGKKRELDMNGELL